MDAGRFPPSPLFRFLLPSTTICTALWGTLLIAFPEITAAPYPYLVRRLHFIPSFQFHLYLDAVSVVPDEDAIEWLLVGCQLKHPNWLSDNPLIGISGFTGLRGPLFQSSSRPTTQVPEAL